jgi:hypothetical protein
MAETQRPDETTDAEPDHFQFGIRQMLLLTTVSALAAAAASSMSAPKVFQGIAAAYLIFMAAYVLLRLPYVLRRCRRPLEKLRRNRSELEAAVRDMKHKARKN